MKKSAYQSQLYWKRRKQMLYYRYIQRIIKEIGASAQSMIDVGSGNCPYLEWFDWIPERVSVDIRVPYSSEQVQGIQGDIFQLEFPKLFDVCTCLQVLEHVPDAGAFAKRLLQLARTVVVSVPYKWPNSPKPTPGHVHDPVDYAKLSSWMGRKADYKIIVEEPLSSSPRRRRLIAIYTTDAALIKNALGISADKFSDTDTAKLVRESGFLPALKHVFSTSKSKLNEQTFPEKILGALQPKSKDLSKCCGNDRNNRSRSAKPSKDALPKIILHVGIHKTGTTSIQKALFENRDWLADRGLLYPVSKPFNGSRPHHGFAHAIAIGTAAGKQKARKWLVAASGMARDGDQIIISSEPIYRHLVGGKEWEGLVADNYEEARTAYLSALSDVFRGYDVEVIVYLRDYGYWLAWLHRVLRRHKVWPHGSAEFTNKFSKRFDYDHQIGLIKKYFPKIRIFHYEEAKAEGLIKHFFNSIGFPVPHGCEDVWERPTKKSIVPLRLNEA